MSIAASEHELIACPACDRLFHIVPLHPGQRAECDRCGTGLYQQKRNSIGRTLALALCAIVFFVPANFSPIMTLRILGEVRTNTVITGVVELARFDLWFVALSVFACGMLIPIIQLLTLVYVLGSLHCRLRSPHMTTVFRIYHALRQYAMLEVYLLAIFVSLIKLRDIADIEFGLGFYSFLALLALLFATVATIDYRDVWEALEAEQ